MLLIRSLIFGLAITSINAYAFEFLKKAPDKEWQEELISCESAWLMRKAAKTGSSPWSMVKEPVPESVRCQCELRAFSRVPEARSYIGDTIFPVC